ncbi:hypothetical protein Poly51_29290 [Rubripirellula tenax]|uniref:Uncharacterized protein n=1 Tax=Rubripirellula tenax TaxID=2528015 RepID=A0A5C6F6K8_9BACT|nr:hypothetical protein [Rubripirellula tenax]TWU57008.1 hypothetical protein Poly51_29290 [Rubripirellula tenax]
MPLKIISRSSALAIVASLSLAASSASAQTSYPGQIGVGGPGPIQGAPVYGGGPISGAGPINSGGWYNPEIYNSGRQVSDVQYDPFTGRVIVRTDKNTVRESVLDPNRTYADPGSYQQVNRYETDVNGIQWHVTGTQWTSNGVPHGNLSRRQVGGVHHGGGIIEDRNENVTYSTQPGGQTPGAQPGQNRPGQPGYGVYPGQVVYPGQGGVIEDRNEHVQFSTPTTGARRPSQPVRRNTILPGNLRSLGRNLNPFK